MSKLMNCVSGTIFLVTGGYALAQNLGPKVYIVFFVFGALNFVGAFKNE